MAGAAAAPPGTATMTELPPLQLQQHGVPVQGGGGVGAGLPPMSGTAMVPSLQVSLITGHRVQKHEGCSPNA
eukprot:scaffold96914_cov20-Tisochrysis_lutea.AAC.3